MKKFLIITVSVIAVVVIALFVFVKIYITPEKIKEFIVPVAEQSLNRKIDISEINISLLRGIGLKDFSIKESDGKTDFVRCRDFVLKFKLLPLLAKKVIVDELKVSSPEVHVRRDKEGKFNFEGIGEKKEPEEVKEEKTVREPAGLPISLLVNRISIDSAGFSLTDLMNELPDIKSSADIDISIKSVDSSSLATGGDISLTLDELIMKPSGKPVRNISAMLKYAIQVDLESKDIRIDTADVKVQDISASIKGGIKNAGTSPEIDINVTLPKTGAAEIQKLAALFADLKGLSLSGDISADANVKGIPERPDTLRTDGNVLLDKVGIGYQDMDAMVDGSIKFSEKSINIDLKSALDKNTAELKGTVSDYLKDPKINLIIYSKKLFLDELIPAAESGEKPSGGTGKPAPEKARKEAEPVNINLAANGEVKIDSAVYKGMLMSDFYMKYRFEKNKLTISKMTAGAGKGKFSLNSSVDLSRPGYSYNLSSSLDSLHADEVVNAFFPKAKDTVFGILSFNLKLNGSGTLPENIKKNIVADADFRVKDGKITNAKIAENLSRLLGIKELETINLKQADGTVKIRNSVARLDSVISSDDLSMDPSGEIGLDETLDLAFDLKLSPRLTDKAMSSRISKYIKNEEGWGAVPLIITGTLSDPSYSVDIKKAGKRAVKKKTDKLIDKLFDKQDDKKKKELEPVKDLLKGIFK